MKTRMTDLSQPLSAELFDVLNAIHLPIIQFSKPNYSKPLLKSINTLCKIFGSKLPVRFFGHYQNDFDATILQYLPDVQWLLIDCLQEIANPEFVFKLRKLKKLSFGVYHYKNPNFLSQLDVSKLESLVLSETKSRNIDLANLRQAQIMKDLFVGGHTKNLADISQMKALKSLRLGSISKKMDLGFVSDITNLTDLKITLGGRNNIDEVSHPILRELQIIRVRGLSDLGDLSRFPDLERLHIEDQIRLLSLELNLPMLRSLQIRNCKSLAHLNNLESLTRLKHLRCYGTSLDYEGLSQRTWQKTVKTIDFYSGNAKRDAEIRRSLDARGYREFN